MTNSDNKQETAYDTDKLTNKELISLGLQARDMAKKQKDICSFCGKEVSQPITKYNFHGYDIIKPGDKAHKGCALRLLNALLDYAKEIKEEEA